jgi:hypothetical protein
MFAAIARYELSATGKKIVGGAEAPRHALLHGSICYGCNESGCSSTGPSDTKALVQGSYMTFALNEIAQPVTANMLHEALRRVLAIFEVEIVAAPPPRRERLANALYTTKYTNAVWNLEGAAPWRQSMAPIRTT